MSQNGTYDSNGSTQAPSKPTHRRLVVMFDGTSNTRESMTNVSRMFEAIDDSHPDSYQPVHDSKAKDSPPFEDPGQDRTSTKVVQCQTCYQSMTAPAEHEGDDSDDSKAYIRAGFPCGSCHQLVVEPELQPVQLVKYIPGVGTDYKGLVGMVSGQALGYGLSDKIMQGYTWLCNEYQEGDEVFVFGFSRGAFSARSLVSLLHRCDGVLKKRPNIRTTVNLPMTFGDKAGVQGDDKKAIETAYSYYREYVESTDADGNEIEGKSENRKDAFHKYLRDWNSSRKNKYTIIQLAVRVKMLGVWDTVGALAIPESGYKTIDKLSFSRAQYQFHDQRLSDIVENAYHALALDEFREAFKPTLWTSQHPNNQEVKQVWFVGSHCNVGGGADLDDNNDPDDLWQYSYVWMQRHAEKHGLRFFWKFEYPATRQAASRTRRVSLREPEPSWKKFAYGIYSKVVDQYFRKTDPELAMLHWSVLERIKVTEADRAEAAKNGSAPRNSPPYRPESLFGDRTGDRTYDEFMATVVPEGSTEVDAKGGGTPPKWHIETDDVMTHTQWALPVDEEEKGKHKKKEDKKVQ